MSVQRRGRGGAEQRVIYGAVPETCLAREAGKDYGRLLGKLRPMLAPGARILACLNAPYLGEQFLVYAFARHLPEFQLVERLPQRADFPERDLECCLKMQIFQEGASLASLRP